MVLVISSSTRASHNGKVSLSLVRTGRTGWYRLVGGKMVTCSAETSLDVGMSRVQDVLGYTAFLLTYG